MLPTTIPLWRNLHSGAKKSDFTGKKQREPEKQSAFPALSLLEAVLSVVAEYPEQEEEEVDEVEI